MIKKIIILTVLILNLSLAIAQSLFQNSYDASVSLEVKNSGPTQNGILICGTTEPNTSASDGFIVKTDLDGNIVWSYTYGGNDEDVINEVKQTSDGGYIATGYTRSAGAGDEDLILLKLDANGGIVWSKTYGTITDDYGLDVIQTSDGGYAACGVARSVVTATDEGGFYILKTNSSGTETWSKMYGQDGSISAYNILQKADGSLLVSGSAWGSSEITIQEIDVTDGSINWANAYTVFGPYANNIEVIQLPGDSLMAYCSGWSTNTQTFVLLKIDPQGNDVWSYEYKSNSMSFSQHYGKLTKTWGGYLIAGTTYGNNGSVRDINMIRLDKAGNVRGSRMYYGSNTYDLDDSGLGLSTLSDGSKVAAATYGSKIMLYKTNWAGNMGCPNSVITTQKNSLTTIYSGNFNFSSWNNTGTTSSGNASFTSSNFNLTANNGCSTSVGVEDEFESSEISVYPNPFNEQFTIDLGEEMENVEVKVYDMLSREVYSAKGNNVIEINLEFNSKSSSIYFYKVTLNGNTISTGKIVSN